MSLASKTFLACLVDTSDVSGSSSRVSRRVLLNPDLLKSAKVFAGDVIAITAIDQDASTPSAFAVGIAWPSQDISPEVIYLSASHMLSAKLQERARVRIVPLTDKKSMPGLPSLKGIQDARTIVVTESTDTPPSSVTRKDAKKPDWLALYIREVLVDMKYVFVGQKVQVAYEARERVFTVAHVSSNMSPSNEDDINKALASLNINASVPVLWTANWDVQLSIKQVTKRKTETTNDSASVLGSPAMDGYASVGGLDKQISQIRDLIEIPLTRPDLFRHFGLKPPRGVLLHGPPGTGKTHLARAVVAASTGASVLVVAGAELSSAYHGETERRLRDVFAEARRRSPCIVVLDEVDALAPRREGGDDGSGGGEVEKRVVATLLTILDGAGDKGDGSEEERVVVIGTTNRPNAIDPALRRPGRFDREIEIGIPDAEARYSILKVILAKTPHSIADDELRSIASRTHGYVGADLSAVIREAGTLTIKRYMHSNTYTPSDSTSIDERSLLLTAHDLSAGLKLVQPSALRSITLEVPAVRWVDIGGQALVAQKLRECVEWPLRHPEAFARLGVRAPRGVLLYGPPGCSKTLTARALATESGINFLAVKGPELLNKFVGESERAVRDIFRKARAASPSIVFFDEIDALGTSRSSEAGSGERHEGVLTTLLNEMDGVQELLGVTVVAATNRPDVIDSALMRPGRLDRILYVGPPDRAGRLEILHIRTRTMSVDPAIHFEKLVDLTEGCSGAELAALCQDAALLTMQENIDAPFVPQSAFLQAAKTVRRQITPEVIAKFDRWRESSGLTSA